MKVNLHTRKKPHNKYHCNFYENYLKLRKMKKKYLKIKYSLNVLLLSFLI